MAEQGISTCNYCDILTYHNIVCPKCNKNICYYCLIKNMIHNDGQFLCLNCNNDLHNLIEDYNVKEYKDKVIDDYENQCVICYDTFDENELIRCVHNHPHCHYCYNRIINNYNLSHVCGICREPFKKIIPVKPHEWLFDINDKIIRCQHCHECFEYDTLISYFTSKIKYNKDYSPECMHCHQEWNNTFMYDNFERDFCKNIFKLFDPYACKYCQERKIFIHCHTCKECLMQYFQLNENTHLDCPECHIEFTPKFMYDHFDYDYCKHVLHIEDPYECKGCHTRFSKTYTCKYCKEKICINCAKKYFEAKLQNHVPIDCINCHHIYNEFDLYDDIFENDNDYVKNVLQHVRYPYECEICKRNLYDFIKHKIHYTSWTSWRYIEFISCDKCQRYFCKDCLYEYLRDLARNYKNNTEDFHYVPEGVYNCPCCKNNFSNSFIFSHYQRYYYDRLYLIDNSKKCIECNQHHYCMFTCNRCSKNNCINCLCEGQKRRIAYYPNISVFNNLICNYCGEIICDEHKYWEYLDDETCRSLKLESEFDVFYRENCKHCPKCNKDIIRFTGDGNRHICIHCNTIFYWDTLKIISTYNPFEWLGINNPLYLKWLKQYGISSSLNSSSDQTNINTHAEELINEFNHHDESINDDLDKNKSYECIICLNEYTYDKVVKCPLCQKISCINCLKQYDILYHDHKCPHCHNYDLTQLYNN